MTDREMIESLQRAVIQLQSTVVRLQNDVHMIKHPGDTTGAVFVNMIDLVEELWRPRNWRARQDSNLQPPASVASDLSD